ncbi:hypothetical protein ANCCEY_03205 [Ancylostoma ceylanicum]|uniref:Uncharacterized protein n=1 Tax=Ancylostoma ceylanicum TaxID=53326 RepID=A0A0D6M5K8_9BILA|nr:hypothetical protein ANCCEY_03205 [Ancylostoma ceylanicum]
MFFEQTFNSWRSSFGEMKTKAKFGCHLISHARSRKLKIIALSSIVSANQQPPECEAGSDKITDAVMKPKVRGKIYKKVKEFLGKSLIFDCDLEKLARKRLVLTDMESAQVPPGGIEKRREMKRLAEDHANLVRSRLLDAAHRARKPGTTSGEVGFIVVPKFARNITRATFHGHRLAALIVSLSKDIYVSIIQAYAPTADRDEVQHDEFYSDLDDLVRSQESTFVVVMGGFNARMVDDVNEDYTRLVGTIIKIRNECRAEAPNHALRRISGSTRALLEKRRHMVGQANHVEYAVLSRLCRKRLAEDHANLVRSRLLDAAHRKRSLKMEKRALAEHRLSIPCLKAQDGSRCSTRPEMENVMANFNTALYRSESGQTTTVLSPGKEVPPFLTSEVRHAIETMPRGKAPTCLESVIRNCDWSTFGVLINGERLSHLRFADDIVLVTRSPDNASEMLRRLDEEGSKARLTINTTKTEVMRSAFSSQQSALLQGVPLEDGSECVYPGRLINMENDIKPEIARRGRAGWAAYNSIRRLAQSSRVGPGFCESCSALRSDYEGFHIGT